jgi:hypothetical protein
MFHTYFYNSSIRSLIVSFGQLFNDIQIVRLDTEKKEIANISVPLSYANKDKWFTRTSQDPELTRNVMNVLPRMAFSIIGMKYDASRKLNMNNRVKFSESSDPQGMNSIPTPVPYNFTFKLDIMAKTNNDMLQIVEQILPYFTPHYNISIKPLPETNLTQDVPIELMDVTMDDNYSMDWTQERFILYTLLFTAKSVVYGGIGKSSIIKNVTVNLNSITNEPIEKYNAYIDPPDANKDDEYNIIENWLSIHDIDSLFN